MNSEEFVKLYIRQDSDESITAFQNETGFSLDRTYPTPKVHISSSAKLPPALNQKLKILGSWELMFMLIAHDCRARKQK